MPNPARLMETRNRTDDADGSGARKAKERKEIERARARQSRAEWSGMEVVSFPGCAGISSEGGREGGRERRQKVLRRLFRRMSYERGRSAEGRDGEGRSRGFCVLISQEPTWPLGRSLVGDGAAAAAAGGAARGCEPGHRGTTPTRPCPPIARCDVACRPSSSQKLPAPTR